MEQALGQLDQLHDIVLTRPLELAERESLKNSAQVLIEIALECSREYLNSEQQPMPTGAHAIIDSTYSHLAITHPAIEDMRVVIDIYQTIINHPEDLDWTHVEKILRRKKYYLMKGFVIQLLQQLQKKSI